MKKFLMIIVSSLLSLSLSGLPVYANTTDNEKNGDVPEIYVDENYGNQTSESITPRNRGNCTDVYTREWCNAHGYQNNRPVGGTVALNSKEIKCFIKAVAAGIDVARRSTVYLGPNSVYLAPPATAFAYFYCMW